jgi:hypothetical protein
MNNKTLFFKTNKVGFVACAALLGMLTGCVGYVDGPSGGVYVAPPVATVVVQDDYVYYPNYGVYYSQSRGQYAYQENGAWVSRPAPSGVTVDMLQASPSVKMSFHDSPANHHAEVVRQYPKNWTPPPSKQGNKDNQKDDNEDNHGGNNGR